MAAAAGKPRRSQPVRGVAQLGRALASGARGRRFESCHPDQSRPTTKKPRPRGGAFTCCAQGSRLAGQVISVSARPARAGRPPCPAARRLPPLTTPRTADQRSCLWPPRRGRVHALPIRHTRRPLGEVLVLGFVSRQVWSRPSATHLKAARAPGAGGKMHNPPALLANALSDSAMADRAPLSFGGLPQ